VENQVVFCELFGGAVLVPTKLPWSAMEAV
jgi:hypothetical protein